MLGMVITVRDVDTNHHSIFYVKVLMYVYLCIDNNKNAPGKQYSQTGLCAYITLKASYHSPSVLGEKNPAQLQTSFESTNVKIDLTFT